MTGARSRRRPTARRGSGRQGRRARQLVLRGHDGPVLACAASPVSEVAVTASADRRAAIWDLDRGVALHWLSGHGGKVKSCAVTPDGARAVTIAEDGRARVWSVERGALERALDHGAPLQACALSPDGARLITGGRDGVARVWSIEQGRQVLRLEGHAGAIRAIAVTRDARARGDGLARPRRAGVVAARRALPRGPARARRRAARLRGAARRRRGDDLGGQRRARVAARLIRRAARARASAAIRRPGSRTRCDANHSPATRRSAAPLEPRSSAPRACCATA
ncbi:MAG: hypothetical protein H6713_38440 [Myxococcales bacterium]|nr:hypothetical protein [Myxococcales bacterium]